MKRTSRISVIPPLVIAVAAALAMALFAALSGGPGPVSGAVKTAFSPANAAVSAVYGWVGRLSSYIGGYETLTEENAELRKAIADMEQSLRASQAALEENDRLRSLLSFREKRRDLTLAPAAVTALSPEGGEYELTLDQGRAHGLGTGMCAVDDSGNLVGFITALGQNWATVTTLLDPGCELGARIFQSGEVCVSEGSYLYAPQGLFTLTYLPAGASVKTGDLILTAGKGGVFPADIVMGQVEGVSLDPSGLSSYALAMPAADLSSLSEVYVITAFEVSE